jgi:hypothetical protein
MLHVKYDPMKHQNREIYQMIQVLAFQAKLSYHDVCGQVSKHQIL